MSDLSRLLGDVYGSGSDEDLTDEAAPTRDLADEPVRGTSPDWADESVLDEAFADWVPGPPAEAPDAERSALSDLAAEAAAPETLAEALPEAAEWFFDEPAEPATVLDLPYAEQTVAVDVGRAPEADDAPAPVWQRSDDDLLPAKGRRRR